jgi:hypothetical protein
MPLRSMADEQPTSNQNVSTNRFLLNTALIRCRARKKLRSMPVHAGTIRWGSASIHCAYTRRSPLHGAGRVNVAVSPPGCGSISAYQRSTLCPDGRSAEIRARSAYEETRI